MSNIKLRNLLEYKNDDFPTTSISLTKAIDIFKNCEYPQFLTGNNIYRGIRKFDPYMYATPKRTVRYSANTTNFYTELIDILPSWSDWPKRSQSLICASTSFIAEDYGDVYYVIPIKNTNIGICSRPDFWDSFPNLNVRMDIFNDILEDIYSTLAVVFTKIIKQENISMKWFNSLFNTPKYTIKDIINAMDNYAPYSKKYKSYFKEILHPYRLDIVMKWYDDIFNGNALKTFNNYLDPNANDLKLVKNYNEYVNATNKRSLEVWTDSDCLLIQESKYNEFRNMVR